MNVSRLLKLGMIDKAYFMAALDQLTCIPIAEVDHSEKATAYAVLAYPAVGLLIGLMMMLPMVLLAASHAAVVAVIGVVLSVVISAGRHVQALAEAILFWQVDAAGERLSAPQANAVLSYAMVLMLLIKFAALMAIASQQAWGAVLMAPVLGRAALMLFALSTPSVADSQALTQYAQLPRMRTRVMLGIVLLASLIFLGGAFWGVMLVTLAVFYTVRHYAIAQFGGVTPAMKNGMVELLETCVLFVACL